MPERQNIHAREKIFLIVCPYCEKILNREEVQKEITTQQDKIYSLRASHGICPECLYHHFPQRYPEGQQQSTARRPNIAGKGHSLY